MTSQLDRRSALKKGLVAGGLVALAPVVTTVNTPAFAASGGSCYLFVFQMKTGNNGNGNGAAANIRTVGECASPSSTSGTACSSFTRRTALAAAGQPTLVVGSPSCTNCYNVTFSVSGTAEIVGYATAANCAGATALALTAHSGQSLNVSGSTDNSIAYVMVQA